MTTTQRGILTLISSAIREESLILPEDFCIEEALTLIQSHHIAPIIYDGATRCGISPQSPTMQKLFQSYCKGFMVSETQMHALQQLYTAFDEAGIEYMPVKGCNMKSRYPKSELRMMGDADILFQPSQYDMIVPILDSLGFSYQKELDPEIVWQSKELYLELHKRLLPSYNKDFDAYFGDGWKLGKIKSGSRYSMTPEDEWIYLFTHFTKHFRDGGIGCRHVLDLWVFRRAFPDLNEKYVKEELAKLQMLEFYENICDLIGVWFEELQENEKTRFITEFVFSSGSFGAIESKIISQTLRESKHSSLAFSGRLVHIWRVLFRSAEELKDEYPVLMKMPWLLPLIWVIRPFHKLLFQRDAVKLQKKKMSALSQDNIQQRQDMLNYVGLDYWF